METLIQTQGDGTTQKGDVRLLTKQTFEEIQRGRKKDFRYVMYEKLCSTASTHNKDYFTRFSYFFGTLLIRSRAMQQFSLNVKGSGTMFGCPSTILLPKHPNPFTLVFSDEHLHAIDHARGRGEESIGFVVQERGTCWRRKYGNIWHVDYEATIVKTVTFRDFVSMEFMWPVKRSDHEDLSFGLTPIYMHCDTLP